MKDILCEILFNRNNSNILFEFTLNMLIVMVFVTWCSSETTEELITRTNVTIDVEEKPFITFSQTADETVTFPKACPNNQPEAYDICPDGFKYLTASNLCYTIKKQQHFPPKCDYPNAIPFNTIKKYLLQIPSQNGFWLNAYQNLINAFGHLEWIERGAAHGTTLSYRDLINPNTNENCVIYINGLLKRVSCFDTYDTLCVYSMQFIQIPDLTNLCKNNDNYTQCSIGHYNLQKLTCFCKKLDTNQPKKKNFCKKIVEPKLPFQSKLLQEYFSFYPNRCWIGFYKNNTDFKWTTSHENVNYTWWALPEECNQEEGAFKFSNYSYSGWFSAEDRTLDCALCEFDIFLEDSSLTLEYIEGTNKILLTVDNELSISKSFGTDLHCFTDTNENDFKEKLNISFENVEKIGNTMKIIMNVVKNQPGYYWCVGFQYNTDAPIASNYIVAYDQSKGYGNEYVVIVEAFQCKDLDPFVNGCYYDIHKIIKSELRKTYSFLDSVRLMRGNYTEQNSTIYIIIHVTTIISKNSFTFEYDSLRKGLANVNKLYPNIKIKDFLSGEFCLGSVSFTGDNQTLQWPMTRIGAVAIPDNILCLDEKHDMLPVTRKCTGDFLNGGEWENVIGDCVNTTIYSKTTTELFNLRKSNSTSETFVKLKNITNDSKNKKEIDVYLISSIMKKFVKETRNVHDSFMFADIVSNLMAFNKSTLINSQVLLNATDEVIFTLDNYMDQTVPSLIISDKLIVQISEYFNDNVIGAVLYTPDHDLNNFDKYTFLPLYNDTNLTTVLNDDRTEIIILIPMQQISEIRLKLSIKIFYNDILFNELSNVSKHEINNKIISVSVNGLTGPLTSPITIAFKRLNNYKVKNCSYWKYGLDSKLESVHGKWIADNSSYNHSAFEICNFYHMTHFGLLLQGPELMGQRNIPLEMLIAIGSALSLIGVIPIFLSAIWFRTWRIRTGNIILINFCLAIALQSVLTFCLYAVGKNGKLCTILGASLHYFDIAEFCWMLIVAYLQYRRFVTVFNHKQTRLLGKCLIVGWVTPFIPILVILIIAPEKYRLNSYGYCYVVEEYFLYGSLIPILVILAINTIIFMAIMYSIWKQKSEEYRHHKNFKLEILLAVFLFFTLGLTWFLGIAGALGAGIWFTYLFCAMTSIRGLILFLFFVFGNKELKMLWQKRYHYYVKNGLQESSTNKQSNSATISNE